jgi:uncharacterized membrane protein
MSIHAILGPLHLAAGFVALVAFWFPLFLKKGSRLHRTFGWTFVGAMGFILASAAVMTTARIIAGDLRNSLFLGFLTLITFAAVYAGLRVLRIKQTPDRLYRWDRFAIDAAILIAALGLLYSYFFVDAFVLWLVFGIVGLVIAVPDLRRFRNPPARVPRWWWFEHMQSMIIAGMAAHIAFFAFGATRIWPDLYAGQPWWLAVLPWVAPFPIAFAAIALLERYYRRKFAGAAHVA